MTNKTSSTLAPGIQEPTSDWAAVVEACGDKYAFAAEVGDAEALEAHNLAEAKQHPDWQLWEKAIVEELKLLREAGTWELVDLPKNVNIVSSKWVFKAKKDASGNVVCYKACLVAQGFSQVPGVDYFNTFAPVAHLASIQTVLVFVGTEDYKTGQIDIKSACLNGELTDDEVIYMQQVPGYEIDKGEKVYRLRKSLYGLKQAGRRWYQKLVEIMLKLGFGRCESYQAVFYRRCEVMRVLIVVLVHIDDCTIVGKNQMLVNSFKAEISKYVDITNMGGLHWILGIEVHHIREDKKLLLSKKSYIESIL